MSSRWNQRASSSSTPSARSSPAAVARRESQHQRVRERPRLAPEVAHVLDFDAGLFEHLAKDRLLEALAGLDEARQHAVDAAAENAPSARAGSASPLDTATITAGAMRGKVREPAGRAHARALARVRSASARRRRRRSGACGPTRRSAPRAPPPRAGWCRGSPYSWRRSRNTVPAGGSASAAQLDRPAVQRAQRAQVMGDAGLQPERGGLRAAGRPLPARAPAARARAPRTRAPAPRRRRAGAARSGREESPACPRSMPERGAPLSLLDSACLQQA